METKKMGKGNKRLKSKRVNSKETFKPEIHFGLKLQDAYKEVEEAQTQIAVVLQECFPGRDLKQIRQILDYNRDQKTELINITLEDVKNFQKIEKKSQVLTNSLAARIVAVHRVLSNKGSRSPGITKYKPKTNEHYKECVEWLRYISKNPKKYKAKPLERKYIQKKVKIDMKDIEKPSLEKGDTFANVKGLRPLSILTIKDRMLQAVNYIGIEPFSEHFADESSYGFRKGRSPAWAAHSILTSLRGFFKATWMLEVDISKCFDSIDHEWIRKYIPIIDKHILNQWLIQGYMLKGFPEIGLQATTSGIPQGGIISPVICNMVLDGFEKSLTKKLDIYIKNGQIKKEDLGYKSKIVTEGEKKSRIIRYIRFADDILILAKSKFAINLVYKLVENFLNLRGLKIQIDKNNILDISGGKVSFKFVAYEFEKITHEKKSFWFLRPPEDNIKRIQEKLALICFNPNINIRNLFLKFNQTITSWANYYYTANARARFRKLHQWIFLKFYNALTRRIRKIKSRYIKRGKRSKNKRSVHKYIVSFYLKDLYYRGTKQKWFMLKNKYSRKREFILFNLSVFKIKNNANFTKIGLRSTLPEERETIAKINLNYRYGLRGTVLKKFKDMPFCCHSCFINLMDSGIGYQFHHIQMVKDGGKNTLQNLSALCIPCHKEITTAVSKNDENKINEYIEKGLLKIPIKEDP